MEATRTGVVELRNYRLHPGRRDELIALFEREFVEPQEAAGMRLFGLFEDVDRPDRFVWLRGFENMETRKASLERFYGGPVWHAHRDDANATMADSDDVLLLRPTGDGAILADGELHVRGPLLCASEFSREPSSRQLFERFQTSIAQKLSNAGGTVLGTFATETATNTYPRLPVREGVNAFVVLTSGVMRDALGALLPEAEIIELVPTLRSRVQLAFAGKPGDFDFLCGIRTVTHRRLRERLRGCSEWIVATGTYRGYALGHGVLSTDDIDLPLPGLRGCSIRHLDLAARRWSIYWTTSNTGKLFPPVHGGFRGDRGEFYGTDVENGTPVLARYVWSDCATERPRWDQAFSTDGGATWETNWIMEFA